MRKLIDDHLISLGIDPKIPPIQLTDAEFDTHLARAANDRAKASEMAHAIRSHIRKHLDEDPVRFRKLSEHLDEILQTLGKEWDALIAQLQAGRERAVTAVCAHQGIVDGEGFLYLGRSYRLRLVDEQCVPVKLLHGRFQLRRDLIAEGRNHLIQWYSNRAKGWLWDQAQDYLTRMEVKPAGIRPSAKTHGGPSANPEKIAPYANTLGKKRKDPRYGQIDHQGGEEILTPEFQCAPQGVADAGDTKRIQAGELVQEQVEQVAQPQESAPQPGRTIGPAEQVIQEHHRGKACQESRRQRMKNTAMGCQMGDQRKDNPLAKKIAPQPQKDQFHSGAMLALTEHDQEGEDDSDDGQERCEQGGIIRIHIGQQTTECCQKESCDHTVRFQQVFFEQKSTHHPTGNGGRDTVNLKVGHGRYPEASLILATVYTWIAG
ncbi:MAG: DUF45 domain-containing protein [Magnetococcales bacterium]|nr:DUF45 domain-containing protein [Magnetococcales bacterium]